MVMQAAVPIKNGNRIVGIVYGGRLINRNHDLIDRIHDAVYKDELYKGTPMGTATIFLHDSRIATTVRRTNGNRALGTRVSKEVADRVLDNGKAWIGDAFVVEDWYITAYEPIRDGFGEIVGMLYVGILKKPFGHTARNIALVYVFLSLFVLLVALVVAFILAGRLAQPIHRLVAASNSMSNGSKPSPVTTEHACHETSALIQAFNQMTDKLAEREQKLTALNRSYMDMLGFVSHELKSPVATMMNYVYLLQHQKLGPLNEKQMKAVRSISSNSTRLVEMVRHYLNLSRIENAELEPVKSRVDINDEIISPILESMEGELAEKGMRVENRIPNGTLVYGDKNMMREVFENLLSNAYKYGRDGGEIMLGSEVSGDFLQFRVRNEGEGIPPERMNELFRKFSRLEESEMARKQKGTGLGLFITRNIVEAHGGTIRAESEPGQWTEFILTLPVYTERGAVKS
jgi:two-component system NtrC family sensor kinase